MLIILIAPIVVFAVHMLLEFIYDRLGSHLMFKSWKNECICDGLVAVIMLLAYFGLHAMGDIGDLHRWLVMGVFGIATLLSLIVFKAMHMDELQHHVDYDAAAVIPIVTAVVLMVWA